MQKAEEGQMVPSIKPVRNKLGVGIKMIKMDNFPYFSIKSYVVDVY